MRFFIWGLGVILVDRKNVDLTSVRTCITALKSGKSLIIFPEGTRNRSESDKLQEIKHGAAMMSIKANAPIVPSVIKDKQRVFRKNYIYIGEPLQLQEFAGGRLDSEKLNGAAELMGNSMIGVREKLEAHLIEKRKKV